MLTAATPHVDLDEQISGRVVTAADTDWDAVRQVFNLTTSVRPTAMVLAQGVDDVVAAVRYARARGLRVAAQSTGHNAAPLGNLDDVVLIDTRHLRDIEIDAERRVVRIGTGVLWQDLIPRLSAMGLAALHGSSPLVGIAGYSLGGGMGWLARKHGLQTNSVTALELVRADGRLVRVDAEHERDLFWALRGGNGNFGVVTAIEFTVYPVPELYAGALFFPYGRADEVLRAWTAITPSLPDEMMTWTSLLQFPDLPDVPDAVRGQAFTVLHGAFLGDAAEGERLLGGLRDLGPLIDTFAMVPPAALADMAMDPTEPLPLMSTTALVDDLPAERIDDLLSIVGSAADSPLPLVQIRHMGGALDRHTSHAGARATLPGRYCVFTLGVPVDEASAAHVRMHLDQVEAALSPVRVGQYPNFVEEAAETSSFFDDYTWARLRAIKARHDPTDLFRGNHHIPPAQPSAEG
jgi:hypothetical protein